MNNLLLTLPVTLLLLVTPAQALAEPIDLRVGTFNILRAFNGPVVDDKHVANPVNLQTTIDEFNAQGFDFVGLQEAHDFAALEKLASGTGMNMRAAKTHVHYIFPPAVFSNYPIRSYATYNFDGTNAQLVETEVEMPDGSTIFVFSIHLHWDRWKRVQTFVAWELILRRAGSHPVLIFGDMNGNTSQLIQQSRGVLSVLFDVNIDAIVGSAHFERVGNGTNLGNLGFSDHPFVIADIRYTPGTAAQAANTSLYKDIYPGSTWDIGPELIPNPAGVNGIRVTKLPGKGVLKLHDAPLTIDEEVLLADISGVNYQTESNHIGKDDWSYQLLEPSPPSVSVPRFVDINIESIITSIGFGQYTDVEPPSTAGHGYADLDYAAVGKKIYAHLIDDSQPTDYDLFNENLPEELRGLMYIKNGGRNESQWQGYKRGQYISFELTMPSYVYVAKGRRWDGSPREMHGWTPMWSNVQFNDGNALGFDIFRRKFSAETVSLRGNQTGYGHRYLEENMVIFVEPTGEVFNNGFEPDGLVLQNCNLTGGTWSDQAQDCQAEDCETLDGGRYRSWDGKTWCRALQVHEAGGWNLPVPETATTLDFWIDWGAWDLNDCGDGQVTMHFSSCGLNILLKRGEAEQFHSCSVLEDHTLYIFPLDGGECDYVIIGDPIFH